MLLVIVAMKHFWCCLFVFAMCFAMGINILKLDFVLDSAKHAALRRNSKDWLFRNQDNVSEWGDMYISGLLFQCASNINIQLHLYM